MYTSKNVHKKTTAAHSPESCWYSAASTTSQKVRRRGFFHQSQDLSEKPAWWRRTWNSGKWGPRRRRHQLWNSHRRRLSFRGDCPVGSWPGLHHVHHNHGRSAETETAVNGSRRRRNSHTYSTRYTKSISAEICLSFLWLISYHITSGVCMAVYCIVYTSVYKAHKDTN